MKIFSIQKMEGYGEDDIAREVNKKQKVLVFSISILLLSALAFFLVKGWESLGRLTLTQEAPRVGAWAPDFMLRNVDGKTVRLADFRGKNPVLLNFWASWCPACRQEAPENEKLHQRLGPKGLKFLAVSIDRDPGALNDVRKFMEEFKLSLRPLLDSNGEVFEHYGVTAIPTTFLIDRRGKIVAKEVGPKNWTSADRLGRLEKLFN